jgi:hypothetical protein
VRNDKNTGDVYNMIVTRFTLNINSIAGKSGVPPPDGNKNDRDLGHIELVGQHTDAATPLKISFRVDFYPDGTSLDPASVIPDGDGKKVQMDLNLSQLEGVLSLLLSGRPVYATYADTDNGPTAAILADYSSTQAAKKKS